MLSRPRRPRRSGEWTETKAVTFIVTLAATQSVTLAARRAGISRKSAYALKSRDPAFAEAWKAAIAAGRPRREGDKVAQVHGPRARIRRGNSRRPGKNFDFEAILRDNFFAGLAANRNPSPSMGEG